MYDVFIYVYYGMQVMVACLVLISLQLTLDIFFTATHFFLRFCLPLRQGVLIFK